MVQQIWDLWDDPAFGLTVRHFVRWPAERPLQRDDYEQHLQGALDDGVLSLPVYCIGTCTLFKDADGSTRLGAAMFTNILFAVCGPMGLPDPPLVFMEKKGLISKRINVMVPGSGSNLRYDDFFIEDVPFQDTGNIEMQFTHMNLPVFRIAFGYWKRGRYKDQCWAQARAVTEAIERARSGEGAN